MALMIPKVVKVTTKPAIKTPRVIKGKAFFQGIPNKKAHKDPVQAPVKGKGMATRITRANSFHCSNFF